MGRTLIILTLCAGTAHAAPTPCNNSSTGSPDPQAPDFNPYHPDFDFDGDGIPNGEDTDKDGDGVPDCSDPEVYTRPSQNPSWPALEPIPWWDQNEDEAPGVLVGGRGWDGGTNGGCPTYLSPFDCFSDPDGDGVNNLFDNDDDGDGIPDSNDPDHPSYDPTLPGSDMDCDGIPNQYDDDIDGDGIPNECDPNPADGCTPDTDPIPGSDCDDDPGGPDPGNPGDGDPPTPPGGPGGPPDKGDPPPPHDRPDPSPPDDGPPDPGPPPPPVDPPGVNPPPPTDDECCEAITTRLDDIIDYTYRTAINTNEIREGLQRLVGGDGTTGYFQTFYQRMISDSDSFRNRVDDVGWTIADHLQLIHFELEYTNQLLTDQGDGSGPGISLPGTPADLAEPSDALNKQLTDVTSNLDEYSLRDLLPDLSSYSDPKSPPVWAFSIPWPQIPGATDRPPIDFQIDWSFFSPVRPLAHGMIILLVTLNAARMLWEELRRYG